MNKNWDIFVINFMKRFFISILVSAIGFGSDIFEAIRLKDFNTVNAYLKENKDINKTDTDDRTFLHYCAHHGQLEIIKLLIEKGANINKIDMYGNTPFYCFIYFGYLEIISFLIEKEANINQANRDGETPLHRAANYGHLDVV